MRPVIFLFVALCTFAADIKSPRALVTQGMDEFRAGDIDHSIKTFEAAAKLQPTLRPHLWQLGISYYYAGEYEKGRKLFESHQTVNRQDVENAVWHFLCVSRLEGTEAARKDFITITDDRRIPMKEVHALFAGKGTEEDVLTAARAGKPSESELKERLFYAHLYLGLYNEARKEPEKSLTHIKKAAGEFLSDHYMGAVARMHLKLRTR
jgi:lipoprotein NlpI